MPSRAFGRFLFALLALEIQALAVLPRGRPTFLNFDQPYPNQVFTLLIWGSDRSKFGDPETSYRGKRICVTGKISDYKGVPEIAAKAPSQVKTQ